MSNSNSSKQVLLSVIGIAILIIAVVGVTFAFFNYTRTGISNTIKVGRISFNSTQNNTINLTNVFPITSNEATGENSNYDEVEIIVTGDTTYDEGVEYLVTATDVSNTINNKKIPININVTASEGLGTLDEDYYDNRGGSSAIYRIVSDETINSGDELVVGYIPKGVTGVNGEITIKAYLNKDRIAISDTYPAVNNRKIVNSHMTEEEMNDCISYLGNNLYYWLDGENATLFCNGTGTNYGQTFQEKLDTNHINTYIIDYLLEHNIIISVGNTGTTDEWVDGRVVFTTDEWNGLNSSGLSFKIKVEANEGIWADYIHGYEMVQKAIKAKQMAKTNSCNPTFVDNMGTTIDISDDITYLAGTPDCVDMNYVWYSGKLWRIVAIYPNGSMKLITEDAITTIYWGENIEYDGSWIYQWLNEDFYDTLINPNSIILNSTWNYSANSQPVRPETLEPQKTTVAPVGLLNAYELYNTYRCINDTSECRSSNLGSGYLHTGLQWWLINPKYGSSISYVKTYIDDYAPNTRAGGVRPSIVIKPEVVFIGDGTISSPYKIVGDKEDAINNTTLLSSRSVGEYVRFDNDIYRIVEINNGKTKLMKTMVLKDNNNSNLRKMLASSFYYGKVGNTESDDYWDYYLNHTWYNNISSPYQDMLVDDTYYLGYYYGNNYKAAICKDNDLDNVTTKNCTRYTSSDNDKTFTGKVGFARSGEMFASQLKIGTSDAPETLIINPCNDGNNNYIQTLYSYGYIGSSGLSSTYAVRPTITLKSGIKITDGTGMENDPFEISE